MRTPFFIIQQPVLQRLEEENTRTEMVGRPVSAVEFDPAGSGSKSFKMAGKTWRTILRSPVPLSGGSRTVADNK